jgi:hypothetical protein
MVKTAAEIWPDGPIGNPFEPYKPDIRDWGTWIEQIIAAFLGNGGLVYSTRASLFADLAHGANSSAWVIGDPNVAFNGVYMKIGASGSGSWVRIADLPYSFITAFDAGAGTPNAIQATTAVPVSESALIIANVFEANTGSPVTISFNGGSALTIKTNSGNDVVPGGLVANMRLLGVVSGSTFRLVNDQVSSAIVAAAEGFKNAAAASAAAAAASAAGVNLPSAVADTFLQQSNPVSGYVTRSPADMNEIISGIPTFTTTAVLAARNVPAFVKVVRVAAYAAVFDGGGHQRKRVDAQPAWGGIRSQDRFKSDGTTDATNGGWWDVDEALPNEAMFGAVTSATNAVRTAALQSLLSYCGAAIPKKKATIIRGHVLTAGLTVPDYVVVDMNTGPGAGSSGADSAILDKGFNGTMMTLGNGVRLNNPGLRGNSASWTGDGILINVGGDQIIDNPFIVDMKGACLNFSTGGSGVRFKMIGGFIQSSQAAGTNYAVVMPSTEATTTGFRHFFMVHTGGTPFVDFKNGNYTELDACVFDIVNYGTTTTGRTKITNCRIASASGTLIFGTEHSFMMNHCSGPVTLGSGSTFCKAIGNIIAGGGTVTNSGAASNQIV